MQKKRREIERVASGFEGRRRERVGFGDEGCGDLTVEIQRQRVQKSH